MMKSIRSTSKTRRALLKPSDQETIAAFVIVAIAMLTLWGWQQRSRLVDIETAQHHAPTLLIDLNAASWPELTLLPGISETNARRIVASRQTDGKFRSHEELLRISGIGPKSLAKMQPFLLPLPTSNSIEVSD